MAAHETEITLKLESVNSVRFLNSNSALTRIGPHMNKSSVVAVQRYVLKKNFPTGQVWPIFLHLLSLITSNPSVIHTCKAKDNFSYYNGLVHKKGKKMHPKVVLHMRYSVFSLVMEYTHKCACTFKCTLNTDS